MVQFIHQEAKEKAAEIKLKTDEEFQIEKLRMLEAEKTKIRAEYERKEKQVEINKRMCVVSPRHTRAPKTRHAPARRASLARPLRRRSAACAARSRVASIPRSSRVPQPPTHPTVHAPRVCSDLSNESRFSRLKCLKAREDAMTAVLKEASGKLPQLLQGPKYAELLESLILEALTQLNDQKVSVKAVEGQEGPTQRALTAAKAKFIAWATKENGADWAAGIDITFDKNSLKTGIGGVEVVGFGGKITLTNTLSSRLYLAFETRLPQLRATLFSS